MLLLLYSLPAFSNPSEIINIYSLSRDFLHAEKKDIAGDSVSVLNANSAEQALQNSVILKEIFKKLEPDDQKLFRRVSPTWMEETFSFWRRNARILIHASPGYAVGSYACGISMLSFLALWERNKKMLEKLANANGNEKKRLRAIEEAENYKLQDHPFHSYRIKYCHGTDLFSSGKTEDKFWKLWGSHIKDLKIESATYNANICQKLLGICPNLKRLHISHYEKRISEDSANSGNGQGEIKSNEKRDAKMSQTKPECLKIAENLHTLILSHIDEESLRVVLFICPNLKVLDLNSEKKKINALLSPTLNGEFIKLKKLVIRGIEVGEFLSLRQYTGMLATNKFDSLEHLELSTLLSNARSPPFNLYAAVAQASKTLKTLKLYLSVHGKYKDNAVVNVDSFMDLSPFAFPNLNKLDLSLNVNFDLKLDLGTLKGMPLLQKLKIRVFYNHRLSSKVDTKAGAQDWVFEGDRNKYLPTGVIVDYQYSDEVPILCSNLKEFTFDGWNLNEEDVKLLSSWFPNLTHLEAEVNHGALPILQENWQRLEKLVIRTDKFISLGKLRPLKEKKNFLRIFQRILSNIDVLLELKEHNGWLFFSD